MKLLKALFAFYINSSIHVALAVTALVGVTQLHFDLELDWTFYSFVFLGTVTGYNFVKYAKVAGLHHSTLAKSLKAVQVFSGVCAIGLIVMALQLPVNVIFYTAGFGVLTFFYAVPFFMGHNLRSIGGIKIIVVALVWTGITLIIPLFFEDRELDSQLGLAIMQRFIFVIIWMLPFEIRDLGYDKLSLGTLPQRLGINRTKVIGLVLICVVLGLEFYMASVAVWKISAVLVTCLVSGIALLKSKKLQGIYFASFWVESIPILWFLTMYFFFHFSF